jgi:hypothetical protein
MPASREDGRALTTLALDAREHHRRELEESIAADAELVESLSVRLRQAVRRLHLARRDLTELTELVGSAGEVDGGAELTLIRRMAGVRDAFVTGDGLRIETEPIHVEAEGHTYDVGPYTVLIGIEDGVRVLADQREVPSIAWIHPHVQGGRPCLGNVRVGVEKYIGLGEMAAAAQLVLAFLSTYDPAHA